jgi:hypothetical protein
MGNITITISDKEITDLSHGLVLAMKELDKYTEGSDRILAGRLEIFLNRVQNAQNAKPRKNKLRRLFKIPSKT